MSRSIVAMAMNSLPHRVLAATVLALLLSLAVSAQRPAGSKTPRMTSDDVATPVAEKSSADSKPDAGGKSDQTKQAEIKISPEESAWRERVSKARDRANELEREADQTELRVTALRNNLGVSGQSARYRNETAAEMEQAGRQLTELRSQARAAAEDLALLVEYGREKGFSEAEPPKATSEEGRPNEDYYRVQLARLNEALASAQRRIEVYQNRVNDISQHILLNGGKNGGDNFFILQLQKDREEAQQKLDESRAAFSKAQSDLENLKEEARRAGVPPGLFR